MALVQSCSVEGCERTVRARGMCKLHWARWRRHGDPLTFLATRPGTPLDLLVAGVQRLTDEDPCPGWPFAKSAAGYPKVRYEGRLRTATHLVLEWTGHGPRPEGMQCCHSCGNGHLGCWHPRHLRWDSPAANAMDRVLFGLHNKGERHPLARLTAEAVADIRENCTTGTRWQEGNIDEFAVKYGVSPSTVRDARAGRTWSHIGAAS